MAELLRVPEQVETKGITATSYQSEIYYVVEV